MNGNTAIAIGLASIFLGLGIAAAGGASDNALATLGILGFFVALGLLVRIDSKG